MSKCEHHYFICNDLNANLFGEEKDKTKANDET